MTKTMQKIIRQAFIDKYPFGTCPCGSDKNKYFNVGRGNWFYCDACEVKWCVGSNLFSSWRSENEGIWRDNVRKYERFREITAFEVLDEIDKLPTKQELGKSV